MKRREHCPSLKSSNTPTHESDRVGRGYGDPVEDDKVRDVGHGEQQRHELEEANQKLSHRALFCTSHELLDSQPWRSE